MKRKCEFVLFFLENKITAYMDEVNGTQYRLPVTDDQIV